MRAKDKHRIRAIETGHLAGEPHRPRQHRSLKPPSHTMQFDQFIGSLTTHGYHKSGK